MKRLAVSLAIGWLSLPSAATRASAFQCIPFSRDPGNLPLLDLRADGSFHVVAIGDQGGAPLLKGSWAYTQSHLMLVVPPGGCASAPNLERIVAVFVSQGGTLYPAMSTASRKVAGYNPQLGCPDYDAADIETYAPTGRLASMPAGLWQGHRVPGAKCSPAENY